MYVCTMRALLGVIFAGLQKWGRLLYHNMLGLTITQYYTEGGGSLAEEGKDEGYIPSAQSCSRCHDENSVAGSRYQ